MSRSEDLKKVLGEKIDTKLKLEGMSLQNLVDLLSPPDTPCTTVSQRISKNKLFRAIHGDLSRIDDMCVLLDWLDIPIDELEPEQPINPYTSSDVILTIDDLHDLTPPERKILKESFIAIYRVLMNARSDTLQSGSKP